MLWSCELSRMFDSALLKVERAEKHISDLKIAFNEFIDTHPHYFHFYKEPETGSNVIEVAFDEAVSQDAITINDLAVIIGDVVHNLRSALDHATWELLGVDSGTQDEKTSFPTSRGIQSDYETACNGIKTPRQDTRIFFISLAAYPGGAGEKILALHRLDILDKHKVITPVIGVTKVGYVEILNPNGESIMRMTDCKFSLRPDGRAKMLGGIDPWSHIKLDTEGETTFEIIFGDVEFLKGLPLIETLEDMRLTISDIIEQFRILVDGRTWC